MIHDHQSRARVMGGGLFAETRRLRRDAGVRCVPRASGA
jgi:hypothetical protein